MTAVEANGQTSGKEVTFLGQPLGLTILFMTEMWEKFSFFGMRSLLVYYLVTELMFSQAGSSQVYAWYTGLLYLTPIFGGLLADRKLGRRRAVIIGGVLMALGHFTLTFPALLYAGLGLIILGNGLYLPSLPSQIRSLYHPDDPRRKGAYNVYYLGVNFGAFLGAIICGTLGEKLGWHWGFGAAGIGMLLGLVIYIFGARYLPDSGGSVWTTAVGAGETETAVPIAETGNSYGRAILIPLALVAFIVSIFRIAYEQNGNTFAIWVAGVDRHIGGWAFPATWFQSINPLMVIIMTPFLVAAWNRSAKKGHVPEQLTRMAIGTLIVAGSFLFLAGVDATGMDKMPFYGWISALLFLVLLTFGELYVLPIGLALFGQRSPKGLESTTIALWFLAAFGGNLAAGQAGAYYTQLGPTTFFVVMAATAGICSLMLMLCKLYLPSLRD